MPEKTVKVKTGLIQQPVTEVPVRLFYILSDAMVEDVIRCEGDDLMPLNTRLRAMLEQRRPGGLRVVEVKAVFNVRAEPRLEEDPIGVSPFKSWK